jgi:hypothetical protein
MDDCLLSFGFSQNKENEYRTIPAREKALTKKRNFSFPTEPQNQKLLLHFVKNGHPTQMWTLNIMRNIQQAQKHMQTWTCN